jgi:hypothetical protein
LFLKTNIKEKDCTYDLINNTLWEVSYSYSKSMLNYYLNILSDVNSFNMNNNDKWIELTYDNWIKQELSFSEIRSSWLNKFKWLDCYFISKEYIEIQITPEWLMFFLPCDFNKKRYKISELFSLITSNKKIMCPTEVCDRWVNLKKERNINYKFILKIKKIILKHINKQIDTLYYIDIEISLWSSIKIILKLDEYIVFFNIDNYNKWKYMFTKNNIWYSINIQGYNNTFIDINRININKQALIKNTLIKISNFSNIYERILFLKY